MLIEHSYILAVDDGSGQTVKIVVGIAAAALWFLAQVASSWNERRKQQPKPPRPVRSQQPPVRLPGDYAPQRAEFPRQQPQRPPPPRAPQSTSRRQQQKQQRQRATSSPPPLQMPPRQSPAAFEEPAARGAAGYKVRDPVAVADGPSRRERLKAILRPGNLKKEFILTEILQPPLAMRERSEIG